MVYLKLVPHLFKCETYAIHYRHLIYIHKVGVTDNETSSDKRRKEQTNLKEYVWNWVNNGVFGKNKYGKCKNHKGIQCKTTEHQKAITCFSKLNL